MNTFKGSQSIGPRDYQQDTFKGFSFEDIAIGLVCDGAGGHLGGEQASMMAADGIFRLAAGWPKTGSPDDLINQMVQAVRDADTTISKEASANPNLHGMATTVAVACVRDNTAHIVWVGDSRAYLFRNNELHRLSADHSMVGEMQLSGMLSDNQARNHPQKNVITRALGTGSAKPDGMILYLQPDDGLLLSSDGVMDSLTDEYLATQLTELYKEGADDDGIVNAVVQASIEAGTNDNTTAIWYRHPTMENQTATSFQQLQLARTVNYNITKSVTQNTSAYQKVQPKQKIQLEIIDSLGISHQDTVVEQVVIGRSPQSDIAIVSDPYIDLSHLKLEPTSEGVRVSSLSNRVGTYIKLPNESSVYSPPFDLLVGSTMLRVRLNDKLERKV